MLRFGLLGTLTFLGLFIYFYKTSGKFRKSIIAAFAAATFFFSGPTTARAAGEADAFTPQPQHQSRPSHRSGFFSGRSSNDGSVPGKSDDFGSDSDRDCLPQFPQTESVEKTEEQVERIDNQLRQMSEVSDSGTESESEDDFAEYQSAVTIKEVLELPDIRTYEEAKKYAETNVPERLSIIAIVFFKRYLFRTSNPLT